MFNGYSRAALTFLGKLEKNNNRDWFQDNRSTFDKEILERSKEFVSAMGGKLVSISPHISAEPRINGSIRRINRDTRFSTDKTPYKNHQDITFRYAGATKDGPAYFLRFTRKELWVGGGSFVFEKQELERYREAVDDEDSGVQLAKLAARLDKAGYQLGNVHYKRVPRGYDADHARGELLRYNGLHAFWGGPVPEEFFDRRLVSLCMKHFKKLSPLNDWILEHVRGPR